MKIQLLNQIVNRVDISVVDSPLLLILDSAPEFLLHNVVIGAEIFWSTSIPVAYSVCALILWPMLQKRERIEEKRNTPHRAYQARARSELEQPETAAQVKGLIDGYRLLVLLSYPQLEVQTIGFVHVFLSFNNVVSDKVNMWRR